MEPKLIEYILKGLKLKFYLCDSMFLSIIVFKIRLLRVMFNCIFIDFSTPLGFFKKLNQLQFILIL